MTFVEFIEKYLGFLWETFMYDVSVFSQGWIYYCLLIPAFGYFVFFCIKWSILLFPFWMPLKYIGKILKVLKKSLTDKSEKK